MISSAFSSFFSTRKPAEVVAGLPPRQSSGRAGGEELNRGRPRALDGEDGSVGHAAGRRRQWHQALMLNESDDDTVWSSSANSGVAGSRVISRILVVPYVLSSASASTRSTKHKRRRQNTNGSATTSPGARRGTQRSSARRWTYFVGTSNYFFPLLPPVTSRRGRGLPFPIKFP